MLRGAVFSWTQCICNLELHVCDKLLQVPITTRNFEAKIPIDIGLFSSNLIRLCNNVSVIIQPNLKACCLEILMINPDVLFRRHPDIWLFMFIVPLRCCQNLTMSNVPTRCLLRGNRATAASATAWGLNGRRQDHVQQWLRMDHTRGAGNWITVITETPFTRYSRLSTGCTIGFTTGCIV